MQTRRSKELRRVHCGKADKVFRNFSVFPKQSGFTLLELLVAIGIGSIVLVTTIGVLSGSYFSQKKVNVAQDFASETRFIMERITQAIRNNTIDYDRYFIEYGPPADTCPAFDERQTPEGVVALTNSDPDPSVNKTNREALGYPSLFTWDTTGNGIPDRNLGGKTPSGEIDPCTELQWAIDGGTASSVFLINGKQTLQTAIRQDVNQQGENSPDMRHVEMQKKLGIDTDTDGNIDVWSPFSQWDETECKLYTDEEKTDLDLIAGNFIGEQSEDFCLQAHDWVIISPEQIKMQVLTFSPSPSRDPFLNFAIDEAQIHPHIFVSLEAKLRNPGNYGLESEEIPQMFLQTSASSRTFGNIRK